MFCRFYFDVFSGSPDDPWTDDDCDDGAMSPASAHSSSSTTSSAHAATSSTSSAHAATSTTSSAHAATSTTSFAEDYFDEDASDFSDGSSNADMPDMMADDTSDEEDEGADAAAASSSTLLDNTLNVHVITPGVQSRPQGLLQDEHGEEKAFPGIFHGEPRPTRTGPTAITYSQQCRWELLNIDRRVASCVDNIFFKMRKMHAKYLVDRVSVALRTIYSGTGQRRTAAEVRGANAANIIRMDQGYEILKDLRGTPAYFKKAKQHIFAMCRQLGCPTFFLTLSAADLQWTFLLRILAEQQGKLKKEDITDTYLENLTYTQKNELLNSDPVTCARHFDRMTRELFTNVLRSDKVPVEELPLGRITDYFYRVEFQVHFYV